LGAEKKLTQATTWATFAYRIRLEVIPMLVLHFAMDFTVEGCFLISLDGIITRECSSSNRNTSRYTFKKFF